MNTLNTKQYTAIVIVQYVILLLDICINSFASFARQHPTDLLVLYVYVIIVLLHKLYSMRVRVKLLTIKLVLFFRIQDFCLIVSLTLLLVNFFSTYIFQVSIRYFQNLFFFPLPGFIMQKIYSIKVSEMICILGRVNTVIIYKIPYDVNIMYYIYDIINQFAYMAYFHALVITIKTLLDQRISCSLFYTQNRYSIRNVGSISLKSIS